MAITQGSKKRLAVRALAAVNVVYARVFHSLESHSPCTLPPKGPAILCSNHTSGLDPILIQAACPRVITWMMAREYYNIRAMTWAFKMFGAIPVERNGRDSASVRAAMRALKEGHVLGIFPEGRIETTPDLTDFHDGAATLALKTGVPVYPVYLDGTQRNREMLAAYLRPNHTHISFGPPVQFNRNCDGRDCIAAATTAIQAAVQGLRVEQFRQCGRRRATA